MDTEPLLMTALKGIGIPVNPLVNPSAERPTEYATFNDSYNEAEVYAEDEDVLDEAVVQVHHWIKYPNDPKPMAKKIRKALRQAGFLILGTTRLYDSGDIHTIIEAEITDSSETQKEDY